MWMLLFLIKTRLLILSCYYVRIDVPANSRSRRQPELFGLAHYMRSHIYGVVLTFSMRRAMLSVFGATKSGEIDREYTPVVLPRHLGQFQTGVFTFQAWPGSLDVHDL